jgi:hypothetical protein
MSGATSSLILSDSEKKRSVTLLSFNLRYIDWERIENNDFHVLREFAVSNAAGDGGVLSKLSLRIVECADQSAFILLRLYEAVDSQEASP